MCPGDGTVLPTRPVTTDGRGRVTTSTPTTVSWTTRSAWGWSTPPFHRQATGLWEKNVAVIAIDSTLVRIVNEQAQNLAL